MASILEISRKSGDTNREGTDFYRAVICRIRRLLRARTTPHAFDYGTRHRHCTGTLAAHCSFPTRDDCKISRASSE